MAALEINNNLLNGLRHHICDMVSKAQFRVGSTWHDAEISEKTVETNNTVIIAIILLPVGGDSTVATQFRLLNASNQVLASRTENVAFVTGIDSITYRFKFTVEVEEE